MFKYLEARLKKLPKTEWEYNFDLEPNDPDFCKQVQPKIEIWERDGEVKVALSSEVGNSCSFEYIGVDYMVDLVPELHAWADQYGWEWQCQYQGTYFLAHK